MTTENGREKMGVWHIDGFNHNAVITPIYEKGYQNCTQWKVVKQCKSKEEAIQECKKHNNEITK
jgi:hypothetical protein